MSHLSLVWNAAEGSLGSRSATLLCPCLPYLFSKKQRQLVENVYLLQLPEKQLVFLRVFQLTVQKQGWISVCELRLAAKPEPLTGMEVQCCPQCRCHLVKAVLSPLSAGVSS